MKVTAFGKTAAFGLAATALALGTLTVPAQADPPPSGFLAGAGSDTTQDLMQGVAEASQGLLESWHASPDVHGDITVKRTTVTRPNGSSEGRDALRRSLSTEVDTSSWATIQVPVGSDTFDYARSSSGPGDNADPSGQVVYVPIARDAVTTATGPDSTIPADEFTLADLRTLYRDGASVTVDGTTYTPDVNITLLIPQSGSGTRSFWADTMQIDDENLPPHVHDAIGGADFQEHDGELLAANPDAIGPFSIAQWIAQGNGIDGVIDRRHDAELHAVDGEAPYTEASPGDEVLNPAFPIGRDVYNIVSHAEVTGGDAAITTAFAGANSTACTAETEFPADSGTFVSTIELYGFGSLGADCGAINDSLRAFPTG